MGFDYKNISGGRDGFFRRSAQGGALALLFMLVSLARAEEPLIASAGETPVAAQEFDELIYNDGDRVKGHFVNHENEVIVFYTARFGLVEIKDTDAKVALTLPGKGMLAWGPQNEHNDSKMGAGADRSSLGYLSYLSPHAFGMMLQRFFGPWHGRIAFSTEIYSDTTDRNNVMGEMKIGRKWSKDDVQGVLRYDYSSTNNAISTDVARLTINWRHDFTKRYFGIYNSTAEWNRAYIYNGVLSKYLLLQQELGGGIALLNSDLNKVRVGLSVHSFEVWLTPDGGHSLRTAQAFFAEVESKLPWQITLTDRGILYYTAATGQNGWENKLDVSKKLTETMSVGLRHEVRYNSPDDRVTDYSLLKFLIGVDF